MILQAACKERGLAHQCHCGIQSAKVGRLHLRYLLHLLLYLLLLMMMSAGVDELLLAPQAGYPLKSGCFKRVVHSSATC